MRRSRRSWKLKTDRNENARLVVKQLWSREFCLLDSSQDVRVQHQICTSEALAADRHVLICLSRSYNSRMRDLEEATANFQGKDDLTDHQKCLLEEMKQARVQKFSIEQEDKQFNSWAEACLKEWKDAVSPSLTL